MRQIIIPIVSLLSLAACMPTVEGYQALVDGWKGAPESQLVAQWGIPDSVYQTGGVKYLKYQSNRTVIIPGTAPTYTTTMIGNTAYTNSYGGSAPSAVAMSCETTFMLQNGKIVGTTFRGNDCKAMLPEA
ncbi:hypothetical protein [Celeribacter sp.]|uniref:hypothetical protein n=1 Tax=Celeribacter sp. TaxID=1890673 RepID=UPI003A8EB4B0